MRTAGVEEAQTSGCLGKGASRKAGRVVFRENVALKGEWTVTGASDGTTLQAEDPAGPLEAEEHIVHCRNSKCSREARTEMSL